MFSWHAIPFVRILVPFAIGIFIALYCPFGYFAAITTLIFLCAVFTFLHLNKNRDLRFRSKMITGVFITLIIVLLGYLRTFFYNETQQPAYFANLTEVKFYKLTIDDAVTEKEKYFRCYAKITAVLDSSDKQYAASGTLLLYLKKGKSIQKPIIGDQLLVKARATVIREPSNPEEFNYKAYLAHRNIYFQLFSDSGSTVQLSQTTSSIYRSATFLRDRSLLIIRKYIPSAKELGVAEALLLGYKDDLDPDVTAAFSRTGTLHVLAVSGLHAGIIYLILAFFTKPLTKKRYGRILQVVLLLFGIWLYAFITGLSSSVLRASVMFSFMAVGRLLKYHVNIYNNIFSSAFILLLFNPFFIVDVGFQLSYLAVLGIVFIQPMIGSWYKPKLRSVKYLWGLISVSLAAQLLTFPISIFYFHQFPNYFLLSNMLIIPLTSLVLIGLIALLALHAIPLVGIILGTSISYILKLNNYIVESIDNLPWSYMNGLDFNIFQMFIMYAILLTFLTFCIHRHKYLLYTFLILIICYSSYLITIRYTQYNQRILVVHQIKGHDVFTCIDGRKASIISDSTFINNKSAIKFFLEPYFCAHGIQKISKFDLGRSFVTTNIFYVKNQGLQFYDRILTINKALPKNVQKSGILFIKDCKNINFSILNPETKTVKISAIASNYEIRNFKNRYFKYFGQELKETKSFILISF